MLLTVAFFWTIEPGLTVTDVLLASLNNHTDESSLIVIYRKNELFASAGYGNIVP